MATFKLKIQGLLLTTSICLSFFYILIPIIGLTNVASGQVTMPDYPEWRYDGSDEYVDNVSNVTVGRIDSFPGGNTSISTNNVNSGVDASYYSNGNGTYNRITYTNVESDCSGGSLVSNCGSSPVAQCPAGMTLLGNSCCPNQYVKTTTSGSGKGASTTRTCNPPPPNPPTANISQSKATTVTGETFSISYGRGGGGSATSCVLQRESNTVASNGGGMTNFNDTLNSTGTYTYRTQCYGPGGTSAWTSLNHTVIIPPPTLSFTADQYTIPYNTATTLRWTSANTVSCTASGAWSGSKSTNGSESTGNLTDLTTYFLQCLGNNNQSTSPAVVNINIQYGEGSTIEVDPTVTRKGSPVTVTWDTGTSDPANCQIQTGAVVLQSPLASKAGSLTHIITGETTFTINCEGNRNNAEATVKVLPEFQET